MLTTGLILPLLGFLILLTIGHKVGRREAGIIACTAVFGSFLCFTTLLDLQIMNGVEQESITWFHWISFQNIHVDFTLYLDHLSLLMTLIITGVGFLIHVYSIGYMDHERDYARYFACMNFFVFAMLLLVLAGNLLLLFVGWEGVGLASYLLIGFWTEKPSAAKAATKAFVVNRIGDLGLLIGIILTFYTFGTGDIAEINAKVAVGGSILVAITLLYFCGAMAKSAQLPLQVWLPDAMEGPTPVSALIHAATMVTAGVYLVVRMHPLFMQAPFTLHLIGAIGGATALFAALVATAQIDLKRVLAYSTISQLGLMFLACGVGSFYAAMFHLTTHAFVKALLFLSAGNVVHMMHGETHMEKMGGLAAKMPATHIFFLVGVLALAGLPPFAAFFSKDLILEQDYLTGFHTFFYIGLTASILTAFYMTRAYCLTFLGEEKGKQTLEEAPKVMLFPVGVLCFLAVTGGFLGFAIGHESILEEFLEDVNENQRLGVGFHVTKVMYLATFGAILGVAISAWIYTQFADRLKRPLSILKNAFYIDSIYETLIVSPLSYFSSFISQKVEPKVFEGSIARSGVGAEKIAVSLQQFQSGQIRSYVAWMAIGMVLLMIYLVF